MEYAVIWLFFAIIAAALASAKGRSGLAWFCLGLLFGPFAWAVALLPSLKPRPWNFLPAAPEKLRPCPECAELIKPEARKCRFCRSPVTPLPIITATIDPESRWRCPRCAQMNPPGAMTCSKCGQ